MNLGLKTTIALASLMITTGAAQAVTPTVSSLSNDADKSDQQTDNSQAALSPLVPPKKESGPQSLFEEGSGPVSQDGWLNVIIKTPHRVHPVDTFKIYPYPPKPPVVAQPAPLPVRPTDLKGLLMSTGYQSRSNPDKPYQTGGWRWQYCYRAGVAKSGLGVPHTILSEYQWVRDVAPYCARETKKWNDYEAERWRRYQKSIEDYEKNHVDAENDALRMGLAPMELKKRGFGWAQQYIPPGSWWLTCTSKVPGLTYYWRVPLTAAPGEKINLVLTEMNALIIEGAW